jgi:hypothetical protein
MNAMSVKLIAVAGLVVLALFVHWMGGWDMACDFSCWNRKLF